jgi:RNA polymerase sigma factor (sigma-70 family)
VEVSALQHAGVAGRHGRSPLLRLQTDERLIVLIRRGNHHAFEALVARYQPRLLSFCRHMLGSKEDAEDVLQEVFAAAFNAILSDERAINVRPWLYRIARNRSLNHLRRVQPIGVDSMDIHFSEQGSSTADKVHKREDFRMLIRDVQGLPETQRTALLLREIDALSYEQIAEAMETTVPSVKSLLVRARVSLAEAAEARQMSCDVVRLELGEVAEGLRRMSPPVRRHVKMCDRCGAFRKQLRETNKALAAVFPIGPLVLMKKFALVHLGIGGASGSATAAGGVAGGAAAGSAVGAGAAGGGLLAGSAATIATKAAAGLAAAALVTAGAVEVHNAANQRRGGTHDIAAAQPQAPVTSAAPTFTHALAGRREAPHTRTRVVSHPVRAPKKDPVDSKVAADKVAKATQPAPATDPTATGPTTAAPDAAATAPTQPATDPPKTQTSGDTTTLPPETTSTAPTTTAPPTTTAAPATTTPAPPPPTTVPPDVPLPSQSSPPADQGGSAPPQDGGGSASPDQSPADLSQPAS